MDIFQCLLAHQHFCTSQHAEYATQVKKTPKYYLLSYFLFIAHQQDYPWTLAQMWTNNCFLSENLTDDFRRSLASDTRHWDSFHFKESGTTFSQIQSNWSPWNSRLCFVWGFFPPSSFQWLFFIQLLVQSHLLILVHTLPWAEVFNRETQAVLHKH